MGKKIESGWAPESILHCRPAASWRDYDGEDIFGDYTVDPATGTLTGGRSYQSGIGFADPGVGPQYLHGDQIGTLRAVTDGRQSRGAEGLLPAERRR